MLRLSMCIVHAHTVAPVAANSMRIVHAAHAHAVVPVTTVPLQHPAARSVAARLQRVSTSHRLPESMTCEQLQMASSSHRLPQRKGIAARLASTLPAAQIAIASALQQRRQRCCQTDGSCPCWGARSLAEFGPYLTAPATCPRWGARSLAEFGHY